MFSNNLSHFLMKSRDNIHEISSKHVRDFSKTSPKNMKKIKFWKKLILERRVLYDVYVIYPKVNCSKATCYTKSVAQKCDLSIFFIILDIFPWDIKDFVSRRSGQAGIFRYSPNLRGVVLHDPVVDSYHQHSVRKRFSYILRKNNFCKKSFLFHQKCFIWKVVFSEIGHSPPHHRY